MVGTAWAVVLGGIIIRITGVAGIAAVQRGQGAGELRRSHRIVPQAGFVAGGTGRQPFQLRPKSLLTLQRNSLE